MLPFIQVLFFTVLKFFRQVYISQFCLLFWSIRPIITKNEKESFSTLCLWVNLSIIDQLWSWSCINSSFRFINQSVLILVVFFVASCHFLCHSPLYFRVLHFLPLSKVIVTGLLKAARCHLFFCLLRASWTSVPWAPADFLSIWIVFWTSSPVLLH